MNISKLLTCSSCCVYRALTVTVHMRSYSNRSTINKSAKSIKSALVESLQRRIRTTGPITVAEYMRECLTHPNHGYYMRKDVFGTSGDFITSPEISQMFGELLGVWVAAEWQRLNTGDHLHVIEFGPGRGTLAADMLRAMSQFDFMKGKLSLHLIDVSPKMRELQGQTLCGGDTVVTGGVESSKTKYGGISVSWHNSLSEVDLAGNCCFIAHEFLDALPIHKFQKNKEGIFHEVLIDIADDGDPHHLREVLSPSPNANSKMLVDAAETRDHVEVSPMSGMVVQEMASYIDKHGGFALIADYGHDGHKEDTFRGFKSHKLHNPLAEPGEADLTADVDFMFLRRCVRPFNVATHGPISQQVFLHNMGISIRLKTLLSQTTDDKHRTDLLTAYRMLCSPDEMGDRFKFFTMHSKGDITLPTGLTSLS